MSQTHHSWRWMEEGEDPVHTHHAENMRISSSNKLYAIEITSTDAAE